MGLQVTWVGDGERSPFAGYLMTKEQGAKVVARLQLLERALEVRADLLEQALTSGVEAADAHQACQDDYMQLMAQWPDDVQAQPVWWIGALGAGGGLVLGVVVGVVLVR